MKILVTGGAGFIGSNLSVTLSKSGHEVVVFDNMFLGSEKSLEGADVALIKGDITDAKAVSEASRGCDVIFNEAAASSSPMFKSDLRRCIAVNVDGFVNVMNAARDNGIKRVIYASTSSIYGNSPSPLMEDMKCVPVNMYASTKLMDEHIAFLFGMENGIETIGLRYMSVFGPGEEPKGKFANLVSQFLWTMKRGDRPVIYGDGRQTRDFIYVKDVVKANMMVMKSGCKNEIFNVGTGKETSLNNVVRILNDIIGTKIEPKYIRNEVKNYISTQRADMSKIKKAIGFEPEFSLESGIRDILGNS